MKILSLVLFPVTIHLAIHQVLHDLFEGIHLQNSLRGPQGIIHPYRRLPAVLPMQFRHGLVLWAYHGVVFDVYFLVVLLVELDLNHVHDWICRKLVMLVDGAS